MGILHDLILPRIFRPVARLSGLGEQNTFLVGHGFVFIISLK